ncbi:caspase family protein [Streptomyces sp. LMG1-1-1.1]|uniref:caspase family protein n=1 Tax=Streptomyces sp. LMG1-1-1.1 TaxID=3135245 RepID=UPI0034659BAE
MTSSTTEGPLDGPNDGPNDGPLDGLTEGPPDGPPDGLTECPPDGVASRWVVVAGTGNYEHQEPLPCVGEDLDLVSGLFGELGYGTAVPVLDLSTAELREALTRWAVHATDEDGALVLYFSGHGDVGTDNRHYLLCRDSQAGLLRGTALSTEDLVGIVTECGLRRLLLIIDTCYAGQGGVDVVRGLAAGLLASREVDERQLTAFSVIAAARPQEMARDGAFARALAEAVRDPTLGGQRQPKLYIEQVVDHVNASLSVISPFQHATWGTLPGGEGYPFIPNPRYVADAPGEGVLDLAEQRTALTPEGRLRREELLNHFVPRGRGVERASDPGSFFTGRRAALEALSGWAAGGTRDFGRAVVVTGGPGTGKSSLLGRLLLTVGTAGSAPMGAGEPVASRPVDAAIHARHKTLAEVALGIAEAAGLSTAVPAEPAQLVQALERRTEPLVLVVDALDEAGTSGSVHEAKRIATLLLAPLAKLPCVWLAVGTRRQVVDDLGPGFAPLDLDEPQWTDHDDVTAYAAQLLQAPDGPGSVGRYTALEADPVARAIARQAGYNYLFTRLAARTLARRDESLDTERPDWAGQLPGPQSSAFFWALAETTGGDNERARALLLPLALAEGSGLPAGSVWPAVAGALSDTPVTADDVRWILEVADAHVVEVLDRDLRSVYRLYHESFAEELRERPDPSADQRAMVGALIGLVPADPDTGMRDWHAADPYIRTHLATHAAACGLLDDLVLDPGYLMAAEPTVLLTALEAVTAPAARAAAATFQRCAPLLAAEPDPARQAAQLRMVALQEGATDLADAVTHDVPGLPWETLWADTAPGQYRSLGSFTPAPHSLAVLHPNGRPVIVTVQRDIGVQWWDGSTGERLGRLSGVPGDVEAVAACQESGAPWIVVRYTERDRPFLALWDLESGSRLGPPVAASIPVASLPHACVRVRDTCIAAVPEGNTVRLVDLCTGRHVKRLHGAPPPREDGTTWTAIGARDGRVTVSAASGGQRYDTSALRPRLAQMSIWSFDPNSSRPVKQTWSGRLRGNQVLGLAVADGRVEVATTNGFRFTKRLYDDRSRSRAAMREWVFDGPFDSLLLVCSSTDTMALRINEGRYEVLGPDFEPRSIQIAAGATRTWTAANSPEGNMVLASADTSNSLKLWRMGASVDPESPGDEISPAHRCAVAELEGGTVLITAKLSSPYGSKDIRAVDPVSGRSKPLPLPADRPVLGLVPAPGGPGLPPVLYQLYRAKREPKAWVLAADGTRSLLLPEASVGARIQVGRLEGRPVVFSSEAKQVHVWDLAGKLLHTLPNDRHEHVRHLEAEDGRLFLLVRDFRRLRVIDLPSGTSQAWNASSPLRLDESADLGSWEGIPAIAYLTRSRPAASASRTLSVEVRDLTAPQREPLFRWAVPAGCALSDVRLLPGTTRDALLLTTQDHRLLLVDPATPEHALDIPVGSDILSLAPVDDRVLAAVTPSGVIALRLPPAASPNHLG